MKGSSLVVFSRLHEVCPGESLSSLTPRCVWLFVDVCEWMCVGGWVLMCVGVGGCGRVGEDLCVDV